MEKNYIPFPSVIRIEPSSLCNLKCIHCPTGTIEMNRMIMSENVFNNILNQLKNNSEKINVVVMYHGGEPLLNNKFSHMVKQVKSLGIPFVKTVSNGMLLNDKLAEEIINSGLDSIEISLDGNSIEENSLIRRGCNGNKVIENIKNLIKLKRRSNSDKPEINISTTQFIRNGNTNINDYEIQSYLENNFRDEINEKDIKEIKICLAMEWPKMNIDYSLFSVYDELKTNCLNFCDNVFNTITIRANGDVVPCCYDLTSEYIIDNISNNDLQSIWNSEKYNNIRKSICDKDYIDLCNNCNIVKNKKFLIKKF
ncbi:radical SAM protein [Clostridium tagluense]|uniref:radical SAM protein n=1 Tax=Clostridium tagluense TaxID=360422 RepID=UPI001C0AFFCC|nr:radical SAM protein [Clostridium tagluense]MBU3126667.1 SPASM domain-containing protein [Clostridium tagluense]